MTLYTSSASLLILRVNLAPYQDLNLYKLKTSQKNKKPKIEQMVSHSIKQPKIVITAYFNEKCDLY